MRVLLLSCLLLQSVAGVAQTAQQEINDQVWKPFIAAFNSNDAAGFMAVHSKDVVRAIRDNNQVLDFDEYARATSDGNQRAKTGNFKHQLELRFLERSANKDRACEVGIYKTQMLRPDGTTSVGYGKFLVILRKENDVWKILVDSDSSEGRTISEKDFLQAKPMQP